MKKYLTSYQKERLQKALQQSNEPHVRRRILILLLRNSGKTYSEIAKFLGCSYRTVAHWCIHGDPYDLSSLQDGRSKGNARKVTDEYIQLLMEVVKQDPRELGLELQQWSGEKLATYLAQETGIKISSTQIRRILKKVWNVQQFSC